MLLKYANCSVIIRSHSTLPLMTLLQRCYDTVKFAPKRPRGCPKNPHRITVEFYHSPNGVPELHCVNEDTRVRIIVDGHFLAHEGPLFVSRTFEPNGSLWCLVCQESQPFTVPADSELLMVDSSSRILLHTKAPRRVSTNLVKDLSTMIQTVARVIRVRESWTGRHHIRKTFSQYLFTKRFTTSTVCRETLKLSGDSWTYDDSTSTEYFNSDGNYPCPSCQCIN